VFEQAPVGAATDACPSSPGGSAPG
jgi:hypothetical protein